MFADEGEDRKPKLRVQADVVRAKDPESWEGGGIRVRGQHAANGLQHELVGCVAQSELRATLSEGLVVSLRRENKGDEATLIGEREPVSVSVSRRGLGKESEVARPAEAML